MTVWKPETQNRAAPRRKTLHSQQLRNMRMTKTAASISFQKLSPITSTTVMESSDPNYTPMQSCCTPEPRSSRKQTAPISNPDIRHVWFLLFPTVVPTYSNHRVNEITHPPYNNCKHNLNGLHF